MGKGNKNVFKDLGFNDAEAANLEARARLMILLEREIKRLKLTQAKVAKLLGVKPNTVHLAFTPPLGIRGGWEGLLL